MIPQVGGFQGRYLDNHRNNWRCARTVPALCPRCAKTPPTCRPLTSQLSSRGFFADRLLSTRAIAQASSAGYLFFLFATFHWFWRRGLGPALGHCLREGRGNPPTGPVLNFFFPARRWVPPPPQTKGTIVWEKRNLQRGKSCRAILRTQFFWVPDPPLPLSTAPPPTGTCTRPILRPAALLFAAATATRSQGALLGGFFLYDALHAALNRRGPPQSAARRAARALGGAARAALTAAPTLAFQAYVHAQYCAGEGGRAAEWCARGRFAVYGHVQAQYWGIGFLKYYQVLPVRGLC